MSHFVVGVITDSVPTERDVEDLLLPFWEGKQVDAYVSRTKEQMIADAKQTAKRIKENIANGMSYAGEKWADRYINAVTDEDFYNSEVYERGEYTEDGDELSTYNPNSKWDWFVIGGRYNGWFADKNTITIQELRNHKDTLRTPYAFLLNGEWTEPGQMWWWGITTATEESEAEFDKKFWETVDTLPGDYFITAVDCHI